MKKLILFFLVIVISINLSSQEVKNKMRFNTFFQPNIASSFFEQSSSQNVNPIFGYQIGIGFAYMLSNNVGISSGISYYDKGYNIKTDVASATFNNYYLGIPLLMNLKIISIYRFSFGFSTGICGEIFLIGKSKLTSSLPLIPNTPYGGKYTRSINLSGLIGFDFSYQIVDNFSILIKPNFEVMLLPFTKYNTNNNPRFWDLGLSIGVEYDFK
jgi:hypothetical protein